MRFLRRLVLALSVLVLGLQPLAARHVAAEGGMWDRPRNLSLSGAASAPQLVWGQDEALYAYWWDQFDGLTVSAALADGWETPQPVPITDVSFDADGQPNVDEETGLVVRVTVRTPGTLAGNNAGRVNAFFLGTTAEPQRPLRQASADIGSGNWSEPRTIVSGASAWRSVTGPDGAIHLAIMYTGRAADRQPGLYYMRSDDGGATWGDMILVNESLYVRMASQSETHLQLVPSDDGRLFITWSEPGTDRALYSWSWDGGASWARPALVDPTDRSAAWAQIALAGDGAVLMLWQGTGPNGEQAIMTKLSEDGGWNWAAPQQVFSGLRLAGDQVALQALADGSVLLVAGGQADGPVLAAWRPAAADGSTPAGWSSVTSLPYPLRDLGARAAASVQRWQPVFHPDGRLFLIGADENADVWLLSTHLDQVTWRFPEAPIWLLQSTDPVEGWGQPYQLASEGVVLTPLAAEATPSASPLAPAAPVATPAPTAFRHVVEEGESLSSVAALYQLPAAEIAAANNITETALLLVGQELIIPGLSAEAAPAATPTTESPLPGLAPVARVMPQIVAGPGGQLQAFWWHAFEGLTSAWFDGNTWLEPQRASAFLPAQEQDRIPAPGARFLGDSVGRVHAFWLAASPGAAGPTLLHNTLPMGAHTWGAPSSLGAAAAWQAASGSDGPLYLLYARPALDETPAGLYLQSLPPEAQAWSDPVLLRAFAPETPLPTDDAGLALAADGEMVYAAWEDPEIGALRWAQSQDAGQSWSDPASLNAPELGLGEPLLAALSGDALLLCRATLGPQAGSLYQVTINLIGRTASTPRLVLPDVAASLATGERLSLVRAGAETALLLGGIGGDTLTLATWSRQRALDPLQEDWSAPQTVAFGPDGPVGASAGDWSGLQGALAEGRFSVLGVGPEGGLWTISRAAVGENWIYLAAPGWSGAAQIAEIQPDDDAVTVTSDAHGRVHVLWSVGQDGDGPGLSLWYSRYAEDRWTQPGPVIQPPEGLADHPSLAQVDERLHAVWTGGSGGQIQYASAFAADAYTAASWPEPAWLPAPSGEREAIASHPQIRADLAGRLHVVYAVPINQGRGIYYTRSEDGGLTWLDPRLAFDAAAAGWAMVDHPALAVTQDGVLYIAWLRMSFVGASRPQALYLARSSDGGVTWSEPQLVAEGSLLAPQLLAAGADQVHLLWQEAGGGLSIWHTYTQDRGATWSLPMRVRGFSRLNGRAAAVSDGLGLVYLVAIENDAGGRPQLLQATFASDGEQWELEAPYLLPRSFQAASDTWLALEPLLGNLDLVLQADTASQDSEQPLWALLHMRRAVPPREALPTPPPELLATPIAEAMPTATPTPTARPTINIEAPPPGEGTVEIGTFTVPILSLGGVLAVALLVIGVLIARSARRR